MSKNDLRLLLCAGGILILVAVIFLVFRPTLERTDQLKIENEELSAQIDKLRVLDADREKNERETAAMKEKVEEVLKDFPGGIIPENVIMYLKEYEEEFDIEFSAINFTSGTLLYTLGAGGGEAAAEGTSADSSAGNTTASDGSAADSSAGEDSESGAGPVNLYSITVTCTFNTTYEDFKKLTEAIQNYEYKQNINNVTLAYDSSTGLLSGNMVINMYYTEGAGHDPMYTPIPSMSHGTDNFFGSLEGSGKKGKKKKK